MTAKAHAYLWGLILCGGLHHSIPHTFSGAQPYAWQYDECYVLVCNIPFYHYACNPDYTSISPAGLADSCCALPCRQEAKHCRKSKGIVIGVLIKFCNWKPAEMKNQKLRVDNLKHGYLFLIVLIFFTIEFFTERYFVWILCIVVATSQIRIPIFHVL